MIREPFVWFVVNFAFWLLMSFLLIRFMRYLASRAHGVLTVRLTLNIPISVTGLARMLASKEVQSEDLMVDEGGFLRNCSYADNSPVCPPPPPSPPTFLSLRPTALPFGSCACPP